MQRTALASDVVRQYQKSLYARLGLAENAAPPIVLYRIMQKSVPCQGVAIDDKDFDLGDVFKKAQIDAGATLFYWHREHHVDAYRSSDLIKCIQSLWASASPDDVLVFDDTLSWLITIEHTGHIGYLKF